MLYFIFSSHFYFDLGERRVQDPHIHILLFTSLSLFLVVTQIWSNNNTAAVVCTRYIYLYLSRGIYININSSCGDFVDRAHLLQAACDTLFDRVRARTTRQNKIKRWPRACMVWYGTGHLLHTYFVCPSRVPLVPPHTIVVGAWF